MRYTFLAVVFLLISVSGFGQLREHEVQPKETVYGISKQYGITQEELKSANPFLEERGLQIGDVLLIPGEGEQIKEDPKASGKSEWKVTVTNNEEKLEEEVNATREELPEVKMPANDGKFKYIKVKSGETLASIARNNGVGEDVLFSLNPQLKIRDIREGDVLRLPELKNNKPTVPEGFYLVNPGETVFSLSRKLEVTEDEFYIANPIVQIDGLKAGTYIKIPKSGENKGVFEDGFIHHTVKKGETVFGLSKLYQVKFEDLLSHNPDLENGLKSGTTLNIPIAPNANIMKIGSIKRIDDNEINLGLILPFHLDQPQAHQQVRGISTDILIGAQMAMTEFYKKGKNINLEVLDYEDDVSSIDNLLYDTDFSTFDAVIGPLFASNFEYLGKILENSGIALVSPLSTSDNLKELENAIIASPTNEGIADAIAEEVKKDYKGEQIQILTDSRYEELTDYFISRLKAKIPKVNYMVTKDVRDLNQKSEKVNETLSDGEVIEKTYYTPLMTVLITDSNQLGNSYLEKLKEMDAENVRGYGVKYVNVYDVFSTENEKNIDALRKIGFTFGTNRLVNVYGDKEKAALRRFMDDYCVVPSDYQQLGYDIFYDLLDRMNKKGDVLNALNRKETRLSTKFEYEKEGKAYVNKGIRIIHLFEDETEIQEPELKH